MNSLTRLRPDINICNPLHRSVSSNLENSNASLRIGFFDRSQNSRSCFEGSFSSLSGAGDSDKDLFCMARRKDGLRVSYDKFTDALTGDKTSSRGARKRRKPRRFQSRQPKDNSDSQNSLGNRNARWESRPQSDSANSRIGRWESHSDSDSDRAPRLFPRKFFDCTDEQLEEPTVPMTIHCCETEEEGLGNSSCRWGGGDSFSESSDLNLSNSSMEFPLEAQAAVQKQAPPRRPTRRTSKTG